MHAIQWLQPAYIFAGFAVGALVGMTGVGGGSLMTPLLILFFGVHPATAVGTDLLFAATTKMAGSGVHGIRRTVDWRVVRRLAVGSVPAAIASMFILSYINIKSPAATELITAVLAAALFATAAVLIFREAIASRCGKWIARAGSAQVQALTILVGCVVGVLVTISSVGAGAIGVAALVMLYPELPTSRIVGSDIAHAVPLTLVAGLGHWLLGSTDLLLFVSLISGSVPGVLIGSYAATRIPEPLLRTVLATTLFIVAAKLSLGLHRALAETALR